MESLNVLIACECSQTVCKSFRELGHNAFSCDIQDCYGGHPERHIKSDVLPILKTNVDFTTCTNESYHVDKWDIIVAHPPYTFLCLSGIRWFNVEKYGEKAIKRREYQKDAIKFFLEFTKAECDHIAIENPIGVMSSNYRKPNQIVNPWQFGESYSKNTCLWLNGLPKLEPTNIVDKGEFTIFKSGKKSPKWYADCLGLPKDERQKIRSKTFPGIAKAMAEQWSKYVESEKNYARIIDG